MSHRMLQEKGKLEGRISKGISGKRIGMSGGRWGNRGVSLPLMSFSRSKTTKAYPRCFFFFLPGFS